VQVTDCGRPRESAKRGPITLTSSINAKQVSNGRWSSGDSLQKEADFVDNAVKAQNSV
jgi:hypothetical protein